ncbi:MULTISPECIES: sugar phosphate isomerase/epimerase [unclassified Asaia]|uniref:sugar phosphate isomerase/epimerase family protein n=1 Tax=unclassified Asaia TaxID=2685023 RepID=UPI001F414EC7|nr:TIM barrel protein [Asaia sp. W19]
MTGDDTPMRLDSFLTLWGDLRPWDTVIADAHRRGYDGIEARIPEPENLSARRMALRDAECPYIAIALTGGGVIPRQSATLDDHLADLDEALGRAALLSPRFVNVLGGNDRWNAALQAEFIGRALHLGQKHGLTLSFETHRARLCATPWMTLDVLAQIPEALFTADISHWVVGCERLLDDPCDDFSAFITRVHHVQARVGYDQGPQVSHPAAPENRAALDFHRDFWRRIWVSQRARGYAVTTLTPECGPDGYTHTLPFTDLPLADRHAMNDWLRQDQVRSFAGCFPASAGES